MLGFYFKKGSEKTMEKRAIVFIDGNNLYHNLKATGIKPGDINLEKLSDFICRRFNCTRIKTIYYNSIPNIKDSESTYYKHMEFLSKIKRMKNFEIKTRKLQRNSTQEKLQIIKKEIAALKLCELCKPVVETHWNDYIGQINVKEKGIDVMIAVDMIHSAIINSECDRIILISGDADFIPAMDLIKSKGKEICSSSVAKGYSYELRSKHQWFILDRALLLKNCAK